MVGIRLQHKLCKYSCVSFKAFYQISFIRSMIHLLLHFGVFFTLRIYFLATKWSYLQKIQWKNRMKYDIKVTINAFRHIFIFTSNNKYWCSHLIQIFFFSVLNFLPISHAINKSIFVFLTTLCKLYFFSPWRWHLKRKPNIYVNGNSLFCSDISAGIKIL